MRGACLWPYPRLQVASLAVRAAGNVLAPISPPHAPSRIIRADMRAVDTQCRLHTRPQADRWSGLLVVPDHTRSPQAQQRQAHALQATRPLGWMGEQAFATAEPVWTHRPTRPANSLGPADPSWLAKLSTHLGIHAAKTISPLLMSIWPGASVAAVCCREACACLLQVSLLLEAAMHLLRF